MKEYMFSLLLFFTFTLPACEKEEQNSVEKEVATSDPAAIDSDTEGTETEVPTKEEEAPASAESISYLALGDSYTIGESVAPSERFPVLLVKALEEEGIEVGNAEIIAATGWTTANLQRGIAGADLKSKDYDLVSLLIGVNNQYQGRSLEEYKTEFRELLLQAVELAGGDKDQVFVLSIPDYGFTPFGASRQAAISREINAFNAAKREITLSAGIRYFDITPVSRNGFSDPALVADDGLHPSGKMYRQWVDLMLEEVIQIIKEQ